MCGTAPPGEMYKLDLDTMTWTNISGTMKGRPAARSRMGLVDVGSDLYMFGGQFTTLRELPVVLMSCVRLRLAEVAFYADLA
jgi:hypothetical protein